MVTDCRGSGGRHDHCQNASYAIVNLSVFFSFFLRFFLWGDLTGSLLSVAVEVKPNYAISFTVVCLVVRAVVCLFLGSPKPKCSCGIHKGFCAIPHDLHPRCTMILTMGQRTVMGSTGAAYYCRCGSLFLCLLYSQAVSGCLLRCCLLSQYRFRQDPFGGPAAPRLFRGVILCIPPDKLVV